MFTGTPSSTSQIAQDQPATSAGINVYPPLAPLPDGTFLVGSYWRVWHVDTQGRLRLTAGTGESASTGDGGPALQASMDVDALAALPGGGYLIGDILHGRIRMVDVDGTITTVGGGGKTPVNPNYVLYHDKEKVVIRNYEGKVFEYPEPAG